MAKNRSPKTRTNKGAFGSSQERFGRYPIHPGLDRQGLFQEKPLGCDPALYRPLSTDEIYEVNKGLDVAPWFNKKTLEAWAQNLGYRNQKVLDYKAARKAALGPAWHTITEPTKVGSICRNVSFGFGKRFKGSLSKSVPPGTYRPSTGPHSPTLSFDWSPPCRFPEREPTWTLAANRYSIVDRECIEWKPLRLVSRRGPYDLFSGPRDGVVRNHFSDSMRCSATTWPLALEGSCDERRRNSRRGAMKETGREHRPSSRIALLDAAMCYHYPSEPGPSTYTIESPRHFHELMHPFNSSQSARGELKARVWPSVGRYSFKDARWIPGSGHRHLFQSKVQRTIGAFLPQPMNSF